LGDGPLAGSGAHTGVALFRDRAVRLTEVLRAVFLIILRTQSRQVYNQLGSVGKLDAP
jgi:hypothetical protein